MLLHLSAQTFFQFWSGLGTAALAAIMLKDLLVLAFASLMSVSEPESLFLVLGCRLQEDKTLDNPPPLPCLALPYAIAILNIQKVCSENQDVAAGRLSATVFKLELELKSLKSSQGTAPLQQMQPMHSSAAENTAAQMAALIRKAAAAQEAADSAQQQLSHIKQAHAQHMAGAQAAAEQELSHTSQSLTLLQQELATAEQSHADQIVALQQQHADQVAELLQKHAEQLAAVKTSFRETLAVSETELSEARSSLASTKEQHAKSLAEVQQSCDSKLTAADSKHAVMLAASYAELAAAQQQWLDLDQGCKGDLAQRQLLHSPHPLRAASSPLAAVTRVSQGWAALSSPQTELLTFKQQSRAAAAASADSGAQGITRGESECRALRQNVTALEEQLALAQAETLLHASTPVRRFELMCKLKAAAQGSKRCWRSSDHAQRMQQLKQVMAVDVRKQPPADHTMAVPCDVHSSQQHVVTSGSKAEEQPDSAYHYPSDEDDLDDWTQEDDAEPDAGYAQQTDNTSAVAASSQSTWTIAAGGTDCSSYCSSGNPQPDPLTVTDGLSSATRSENAGTAVASAGRQISSSAQMPSWRFTAAGLAVSTTAEEPDVINSCCAKDTCGDAMPADDAGIGSGNGNAASSSGDPCYHTPTAGMTNIVSGYMYPDEESDLDDWTCDDADASTSGETSDRAVTSSSVAEAKSSSVIRDYPSDEDDLDDWTQSDDDAPLE